MSNPFFTDDGVEDDAFLNHPKSGSSGYMLPDRVSTPGRKGVSPPEQEKDMMQELLQRKREIQERTLDSSHRSLGLLYESERVGTATAEELNRQKEQLKKTEHRLDDINSTLKVSERHLLGIKSVFGGIRNYFAGKGSSGPQQDQKPPSAESLHVCRSEPAIRGENSFGTSRLDELRRENHPGLRTMAGTSSGEREVAIDAALDRNLDEMSMGLSRLKGLAQGLNQELDEHNDIIDRIDHKTAHADLRINKQNKDMNKILKK